MTIYRGVGGVNREIKQQFRGVGGVNREIKEQYRGVGGLNRKVFSNWNGILYNAGNEYSYITGGWIKFYPVPEGSSGNVSNNGTQLVCTANTVSDVGMITNNKIDLSKYNYLYAQVDYYLGGERAWILAQNSNVSGNGFNFTASISFTGAGKIALPISSISTSHYIYIGAAKNGAIKVSKIWLE
ncbi:hypothetical protein [Aminipila terrae]|uniref:Uncharacterized protein n=1 Tax=Aminipila terrae TaxID=2697030 RepID=A0A6P1MMM0_9FIRM|nr:hypothetical protein [Aminipila terrae]QHI72906.1 hypothetical protein Ami3637_11270 [Aminipila terrae]